MTGRAACTASTQEGHKTHRVIGEEVLKVLLDHPVVVAQLVVLGVNGAEQAHVVRVVQLRGGLDIKRLHRRNPSIPCRRHLRNRDGRGRRAATCMRPARGWRQSGVE